MRPSVEEYLAECPHIVFGENHDKCRGLDDLEWIRGSQQHVARQAKSRWVVFLRPVLGDGLCPWQNGWLLRVVIVVSIPHAREIRLAIGHPRSGTVRSRRPVAPQDGGVIVPNGAQVARP